MIHQMALTRSGNDPSNSPLRSRSSRPGSNSNLGSPTTKFVPAVLMEHYTPFITMITLRSGIDPSNSPLRSRSSRPGSNSNLASPTTFSSFQTPYSDSAQMGSPTGPASQALRSRGSFWGDIALGNPSQTHTLPTGRAQPDPSPRARKAVSVSPLLVGNYKASKQPSCLALIAASAPPAMLTSWHDFGPISKGLLRARTKASAKLRTSRFPLGKGAVSCNLSNAMLLKWPSTRCKVTPLATLVSVFPGAAPRTIQVQPALHTATLLHHLNTSPCVFLHSTRMATSNPCR